MMKEILYILLDNYAEHEIGFMPGAVSTDATGFRKEPKYINKMVAPTTEPDPARLFIRNHACRLCCLGIDRWFRLDESRS